MITEQRKSGTFEYETITKNKSIRCIVGKMVIEIRQTELNEIEICMVDGRLNIEPCVSNVIKITRRD